MRAPRFPLQLAVRYRPLGHVEWRQGKTANISSSGVLVQVPEPLQIDTRVEFQVALAGKSDRQPAGEVACEGRVVRVLTAGDCPQPGFAIAIEQYDFRPQDRPGADPRFQKQRQPS